MANDTSVPSFVVSKETNIKLDIPNTQAQIEEQNYTYNQSGFTYNQAGVDYGGVYLQNQDVVPQFTSTVVSIKPSIKTFTDIYNFQQQAKYEPVGPGFFMYITRLFPY